LTRRRNDIDLAALSESSALDDSATPRRPATRSVLGALVMALPRDQPAARAAGALTSRARRP
jgi:hypothetical protein